MENLALRMINIEKSFPGVKALSGVTFELGPGEIHALVGENGAGKSTLMNVLMGIHQPTNGEIHIHGKRCEIHSPIEAVKLGVGMVPQELSLVPDASVAENLFLGNEIRKAVGGIDWKETNRRAEEFLSKLGISVDVKTSVKNLSVAYQQLVQIVRTLVTGADILIFDEPTASLTTSEVSLLFNIMRQLKAEGKSIVFISHRLKELKEITDRITIMRDGTVVHVDDTANLTENDIIQYMSNHEVRTSNRIQRDIKKEVLLSIKNFSRTNEFQDINFDVYKGEIFGIGGLVGSKRTELVNTIFGITKKTTGAMYYKGNEINIHNPWEAIKFGIGYVPEERRKEGIFPILSVRENLTITLYKRLCSIKGINYNEVGKITDEYIKKINIKTASKDTLISHLSGGNQQKVILARWLAMNVDLLILDEPTRGIDVNAKYEIYELIKAFTKQGLTVIIVSSEHEELLSLTDRIMVMHEGRQKAFLNSATATQEDILMAALKN